uniref:Uncharacterized protein n=1 Tax=Sphaerodactylus townsendi TaxID=933632 RepID=A0ACB8FLB4_9SAUR
MLAAWEKAKLLLQARWCCIRHRRHLAGTVVVVLHEVSQLHFYRFYTQFKHLRKTFRHRILFATSLWFLRRLWGVEAATSHCSAEELKNDPVIQKYGERNEAFQLHSNPG